MKKDILSRRDFIRLAGLSSSALLLHACGVQDAVVETYPVPDPDIEISLTAVKGEVQIFKGIPTQVWRYEGEVLQGPEETLTTIPGSYLGPIISVRSGQTIRVNFTNGLSEASIVHWHGLHVPVEADGHPRLAIEPGETYVYTFQVKNRAGMYWYHPHPHGRTGPQVFAGLAGLFIVRDEEEDALGLPSGEYELPLVLQDRRFNGANQLIYGGNGMMDQMIGFLGDQMMVNGKPDFSIQAQTRPYRLRLLNGSNSRIYKLAWEDGTSLTVLGTDGGLLEAPVQKDYLTLAPAQRLDLWVDFSGEEVGSQKQLVSLPFDGHGGESAYSVLGVEVAEQVSHSLVLPETLAAFHGEAEENAVNFGSPRTFQLAMTTAMRWTINERSFDMEAVADDEIVRLGDLEVWAFENSLGGGMGMMGGMSLPHPMHIHGLQFQVLSREVESAWKPTWETLSDGLVDDGWHDTVLVMPGEKVRVLLRFEDFTGLYLYHCHNLEHEDMGMMRNYRVDA